MNTVRSFYYRTLYYRGFLFLVLVLSLLTALLPASTQAQDGGTVYLPIIRNGQIDAGGAVTFDDDAGAVASRLLDEARRDLPGPEEVGGTVTGDPAANDWDGDGVANDKDNCPHQPNPPINGNQPMLCGQALSQHINDFVWLKSRIFPPTQGIDPTLQQTQVQERIHVLLHVRPNDSGVMLSPQQRAQLEAHSVRLLGYLPHNSFYVSLPRNGQAIRQIIALENVTGITALRPRDKVAPQVRLRGPLQGRNTNGTATLDVDFFADVPNTVIEAMLTQAGLAFALQYDQSYFVTIKTRDDLRRLAIQDNVYWIDDVPDPATNDTSNAMAVTGALLVSSTLNFQGDGLVLSMTESGLAGPLTHPDMNGRIIEGNAPLFEVFASGEHAQKVAAIMIADESSVPGSGGVLPEAALVTFSNAGLSLKRQHFGIPEEARLDHGALLNNNSWSSYNCSKVGEYTKRARFYDQAVFEVGISILKSAGNGRGANGSFVTDTPFQDCTPDLFSLPHASASKNALVVGNMSVTGVAPFQIGALSSSSSAGPTADGRLKPDLVAPGNGIFTVDFNEVTSTSVFTTFSGTSASTPYASGVVGLLAESFENQGVDSNTVAPARYKAILTHTAQDIAPSGPDFMNGYGLIQVDDAVRIAEEWSSWGREGAMDNSTTLFIFPFDVNTPMTAYKATLAWDDEDGEHTSTLALKNDLDLTLVSPSGVVFRPFDVVLPGGATVDDGSIPCAILACRDELNNVEQVLADPTNSDFLEQGTWEALVTTSRLVSAEQPFSLVLTPPCPVIISSDVTLTSDISCGYQPLAPEAVIIQGDGVDLNCNGFKILGTAATAGNFSGSYQGILVRGNNATIRNCTIRRFDVGLAIDPVTPSFTNARIVNSTFDRLGSRGIDLVGNSHTVQNNSIGQLLDHTGIGVRVKGDLIDVLDNIFYEALVDTDAGQAVAVDVVKGSNSGHVDNNDFSGLWWQGIRLHSSDSTLPVTNYSVAGNHFEGIIATPIRLAGDVRTSVVSGNEVTAYGQDNPGILVTSDAGLRPVDNTVSGNTILGFENSTQLGIKVLEADNTSVVNNPSIVGVGIGILDEGATGSTISGNVINNALDMPQFFTKIGIQSNNATDKSADITVISGNTIGLSDTGIQVSGGATTASGGSSVTVSNNTMNVRGVGIVIDTTTTPATVNGNGITTDLLGIGVANSPNTVIGGNGVTPRTAGSGQGISVSTSNAVVVGGNTLTDLNVGISVRNTLSGTVISNTVDGAVTVALHFSGDTGAQIEENIITNNSALGIHYAEGKNAVILANEVTSVGAGIGIRLGEGGIVPCPIDVDGLLVQDNVLSGGALGIETLCDAANVTLVNN